MFDDAANFGCRGERDLDKGVSVGVLDRSSRYRVLLLCLLMGLKVVSE